MISDVSTAVVGDTQKEAPRDVFERRELNGSRMDKAGSGGRRRGWPGTSTNGGAVKLGTSRRIFPSSVPSPDPASSAFKALPSVSFARVAT
ncbi:hypothetical protein LSTR_LSTR012510 [Laodelphax striatellus]|uniref:Uncharacterized protein n=1 Tax=Laodelphax striatellus TaxID=195883 RepID=A0A482XK28_LAOST|nr:hypothetical protein LSTR_LSTR012510 [Laodelphax striatellus]